MPRKKNQNTKPVDTTTPEPLRHVRLHLRDGLYRAIRHRLADAPPGVSISSLIAELLDTALDLTA